MAQYRDSDSGYPRRGTSGGRIALIAIIVLLAIVAILFATGFWSADVKEGALPDVQVSGGEMPKVDVDSKKVVVGTKETSVDVPTVTTEKTKIDVPVVGVKN